MVSNLISTEVLSGIGLIALLFLFAFTYVIAICSNRTHRRRRRRQRPKNEYTPNERQASSTDKASSSSRTVQSPSTPPAANGTSNQQINPSRNTTVLNPMYSKDFDKFFDRESGTTISWAPMPVVPEEGSNLEFKSDESVHYIIPISPNRPVTMTSGSIDYPSEATEIRFTPKSHATGIQLEKEKPPQNPAELDYIKIDYASPFESEYVNVEKPNNLHNPPIPQHHKVMKDF